MNFLSTFIKVLPKPIKISGRKYYNHFWRSVKEPKMLWGYLDSTGKWRPKTRISDTAYLYHPERIKIANNVFVWHYSILDGMGGLEIQEGSQIGAWVGIFSHSSHMAIRLYGDHYHEVNENDKQAYPIKRVSIGKYSFVGAGSRILPGVNIGNGVLISTGTLVSKSIPDFKIVSGAPAQIIGDTREMDKKYIDNDEQLARWYYEWQANQ
jgi:acetyltransferase-like isoleucine patch superfamily enzyme